MAESKRINKKELARILMLHQRWLNGERGGCRINFNDADLRLVNMSGANLTDALMERANLEGAELDWARLVGADLRGANLTFANLYGADVSHADLRDAILGGTILDKIISKGANFKGVQRDVYNTTLNATNRKELQDGIHRKKRKKKEYSHRTDNDPKRYTVREGWGRSWH